MRYNRKFLFGLLALVFLLACTQTPEELVEKHAEDATVLVIAGSADGNIGNGSGFFVESDKIATNIHVVAGARMIFAVGPKKVYNIEKVTGYDPERDLVVLKVSGKAKPLELGEGKIGDPIFAVGYPGGGYARTEGIVQGIRKSDKQLRLVAKGFPENRDSVLAPGNSGGPVLNSGGQVIGIAVASEIASGRHEGFGFAITASTLNTLLKSDEEENLSSWQKRKSIRAYVHQVWGEKFKNENYEEAVKVFDKALKLYTHADFYRKLGSAKRELGQYQAAIEDYKKAIEMIPDEATAYYWSGVTKLFRGSDGDYKAAIEDFDKALELNPDDAGAYENRGDAKVKLLNYAGAIQDYTDAINRNPKDANAYRNRGHAKKESKDYDGAIEDYTEAIRLKDDFVGAYFNRGVAKVERPDPDYAGAIEDFDKIIVLDPKGGPAYYKRGNAKKALGQDEDAKQDYTKAYYYWGRAHFNSGNYQKAIDNFDEAITLDPNYVEAYRYRGDAYRLIGEKGNYQKAIENYDKAIEVYDAAVEPVYIEIHVIYNNRGLAKAAVGNYDEAIKDYTKAIELKSNYAEAYYNRGAAYRLRGQKDGFQRAVGNENFKKAVEDYGKAIELKDDFADAHYKRGLVKEALGQDNNAKLDFATAYNHWAIKALKDKQYQEAIKNYDALLKSIPDFAPGYDYLGEAKRELGKSKADLEDLEGARNLYQSAIDGHDKAIELDPERALSYSNKGGTKFWRAAIRDHNGMIEDYQSAIQDFNEAIKRKSDLVDAYNLRGTARGLLGSAKANQGNAKEARRHYKLALKDFKEAVNLDGDNASHYKGLGLANAALGKAKAAIDAFEKAKQLEEAKAGN